MLPIFHRQFMRVGAARRSSAFERGLLLVSTVYSDNHIADFVTTSVAMGC